MSDTVSLDQVMEHMSTLRSDLITLKLTLRNELTELNLILNSDLDAERRIQLSNKRTSVLNDLKFILEIDSNNKLSYYTLGYCLKGYQQRCERLASYV